MEYLYYPGCSQEVSASNYNKSTFKACEKLKIKLTELEDWNCCGATNYLAVEELMGFSIAARNFALAQQKGFKEMLVICNGCLTTLIKVNKYMDQYPDMKEKINEALGAASLSYDGGIKVRHLVDILYNDYKVDKIAEKVTKSLKNLKVAAYSGCQLVRPYGEYDSKEFPNALDEILKATGAELIDYEYKARCCGGMLIISDEHIAKKLVKDIFESVKRKGADCIATACPLCQMNLEAYQG
ncbi:MAG: CoB--CoM heterodisulfide reductase iron-sulfur subunit B family protein, partial [Armatimonadota bacterium]